MQGVSASAVAVAAAAACALYVFFLSLHAEKATGGGAAAPVAAVDDEEEFTELGGLLRPLQECVRTRTGFGVVPAATVAAVVVASPNGLYELDRLKVRPKGLLPPSPLGGLDAKVPLPVRTRPPPEPIPRVVAAAPAAAGPAAVAASCPNEEIPEMPPRIPPDRCVDPAAPERVRPKPLAMAVVVPTVAPKLLVSPRPCCACMNPCRRPSLCVRMTMRWQQQPSGPSSAAAEWQRAAAKAAFSECTTAGPWAQPAGAQPSGQQHHILEDGAGGAKELLGPKSLAEQGLTDPFQAVVTSDDLAHFKPAPDVFFLAAKKLGLKPEECVPTRTGATSTPCKAQQPSGGTITIIINTITPQTRSLNLPMLEHAQ
ncbi:hypothetical protein VOLCADRAFT_87086 [Volvox carteri f. nagariensis]|uniref:Uncharacterized protein n=1 Tax=Volvox carteri f. nagariensis TaxID=3068 RepID=D8TK50_VOLCA|nr:uncharacterized protein VOLCADRAFT_87086 [Volvox carteri f. nagariensis]EFJ52001.1 hypothetical protein VOLCADRAFT_87086 [Volvox carteri f. nagariensis]|eukprot:XP_002946775.1 hypothetical protein VOLCADRAFT_87086 [Volvox carteri f. nagariensis]